MMIKLPSERGKQIRALAAALGKPFTDTIGHLIDGAVQRGEIAINVPGVDIDLANGLASVTIDGFAFRPMTGAQLQGLADSLLKVTDKGGVLRDLDFLPDTITFSRIGAGVALEVQRESSQGMRRVFAPGVARAVAWRLKETGASIT